MHYVYVYIYKDPDNHIPFYVGMGKGSRHLSHLEEARRHQEPKQGQHKLNKIRKILRTGKEPIIQIVDDNLSKAVAIDLECFLIQEIGRQDLSKGPLTNLTMGGDGNRDWTPKHRKSQSDKMMGTVAAKDVITGKKLRVPIDDPRYISGEVVGQNANIRFRDTSKLSGYIQSRDVKTNKIYRVRKDDPRYISGDLVAINKNQPCHENTKAAASKRWKDVPKTEEHNKKNSDSVKLLKWYCNFEKNEVRRFKEGCEESGFVRVSGPHKRQIIQLP